MHDDDFSSETAVEVKYPLTREQHDGDRSAWPWLPGTEWLVCVGICVGR